MSVLDFFPAPTWRDVIDILFLTLVAYQLYVWFRGTRALRVLIGLVVLGGVYSLAKLWGLFLTTWVFQILWQVLLILLLILFQSEIRQVLEKVSPLRFLRSRKSSSPEALAKKLAKVVFELAREKTGALMVLTRNDDPSEFLHAGQTIMALPDPVLIRSIFNHHAPAHDGAMIISEGRITRMGCILPLSERENLPDQYGTRHRAGLGLSERSDAVCLVVSEERGEVSTIVGGDIASWEDPRALEVKLKDWLSLAELSAPTFEGFLKGAFVQNWGPKLGALALITLAWAVMAGQQEVRVNLVAPVNYVSIPAGTELDQGTVHAVNLTLLGKRAGIKALEEREVRVQVGLKDLGPGTHSVKLSARNIDLPLGVSVDRVAPPDVRVVLTPSAPGNKPARPAPPL